MLQSAGTKLTFRQIRNEFGVTPADGETAGGLGGYRISENIGSLNNLPLDNGIPQSGTIRFSDFYSKKLNIVVKCTGGNLAKANYEAHSQVVGTASGISKSTPSRSSGGWQGGKKIFINITGTYSSNGASRGDWAFKTRSTGYWPGGTDMIIDVGASGNVVGRGGNGGSQSGGDGGHGSNGLRYWSGAEFGNIDITKNEQTNTDAYISAGGGGGGGGSDAEQNDPGDRNDAEGGGGGGGNGIPAGAGGNGNGGGSAGGVKSGGGGKDGESDREARGGSGGGQQCAQPFHC